MAGWYEVECKLITYLLSKRKRKMLIGTAGRKKKRKKKKHHRWACGRIIIPTFPSERL